MATRSWRSSLLLLLAGLAACPAENEPEPLPSLPEGVTCTQTTLVAADSAALTDALAQAQAGTCVVLRSGSVQGSFTVPKSVTLIGEAQNSTVITGVWEAMPEADVMVSTVLRLLPGAGLYRVQVRAPAPTTLAEGTSRFESRGLALKLSGASLVQVSEVEVSNANFGVLGICEEGCERPGFFAVINDLFAHDNAVGLWAYNNAAVQLVGGHIANQSGIGVAAGIGVIASHGARLDMTGTSLTSNGLMGMLVDGEGGTDVALTQVSITDNQEAGMQVQKLAGTAAAPKLRLNGCAIERNRRLGLGLVASSGVQLKRSRIASTVLAPTTGNLSVYNMGDGLGVFEQSSEIVAEELALEDNGRTQALVDGGGANIDLRGASTQSHAGQRGIVVQRTAGSVQAPPASVETPAAGSELPFKASPEMLPAH
ncbi:MAG: hypothetical protein HY901_34230 [Deltaproteobacteria bacterium]|nr:hypothetical protein [Deltaproteobacteria bacterium]